MFRHESTTTRKGGPGRAVQQLARVAMVTAMALMWAASPSRGDTPSYDELSTTLKQLIDHYAADCYHDHGTIWRKDTQVYRNRELNNDPIPPLPDDAAAAANTKKKKKQPTAEYLPGSQWNGKAAPFVDGQLVPPVCYNLKTGEFLGAIPDDATVLSADDAEALRKELAAAEVREAEAKSQLDKASLSTESTAEAKVALLKPLYDKAHAEAEALRQRATSSTVTGEQLYAFIVKNDVTLPDFYSVKLQHAPSLYQQKVFEVNGVNVSKKVMVRPTIYKYEWHMRPHSISAQLNQLLRRQTRDAKLDAVKVAQREESLKAALQNATGDRRPAARRLMLFYLLEADNPEEANRYTLNVDAPFKAGFKLARQPLKDLDEIDAMVLGDWAAELVGDAGLSDFHAQLKFIAADAYHRYLKLHGDSDTSTQRIKAALKDLDS
ncbi:MAG: hypothetical protein GC159_19470 [Phycisphaera sp.]|nr:hypothetical protein [Phycisphaera sp.]